MVIGEGASEEREEGWEAVKQGKETGAQKAGTGKGKGDEETKWRHVFSRS